MQKMFTEVCVEEDRSEEVIEEYEMKGIGVENTCSAERFSGISAVRPLLEEGYGNPRGPSPLFNRKVRKVKGAQR